MTGPPRPTSNCLKRQFVRLLSLFLLSALISTSARGTGYYGPSVYLNEGGRLIDASPEFYWELEVKRLSRAFHAPEKFVVTPGRESSAENVDDPQARLKPFLDVTAAADEKDFAAALSDGEIQPPDPKQATLQHRAARTAVIAPAGAAPPDEFASEFAD